MEIARPESDVRHEKPKRTANGVVGLTFVLLVTAFVPRLNPTPSTERATVWPDTVRRGPIIRQVRVGGAVEIERLENVVYVGRPAFAQENSTATLFKVIPGCDLAKTSCEAVRQRVRIGRIWGNTVEILEGLKPGDQIVLSDMSGESRDSVRLNRSGSD